MSIEIDLLLIQYMLMLTFRFGHFSLVVSGLCANHEVLVGVVVFFGRFLLDAVVGGRLLVQNLLGGFHIFL